MNRNLVVVKIMERRKMLLFKQSFFVFLQYKLCLPKTLEKYAKVTKVSCQLFSLGKWKKERESSTSFWHGTEQVEHIRAKQTIFWNFLAAEIWKWLLKTHLREFKDIVMRTKASKRHGKGFQTMLSIQLQFHFIAIVHTCVILEFNWDRTHVRHPFAVELGPCGMVLESIPLLPDDSWNRIFLKPAGREAPSLDSPALWE